MTVRLFLLAATAILSTANGRASYPAFLAARSLTGGKAGSLRHERKHPASCLTTMPKPKSQHANFKTCPTEMKAIPTHQMLIAATPTNELPQIIPGGNDDVTNTVVFVVGLIPFVWATIEFWRRIAVGEPFGTTSDSVVIIGEDGAPESSRGRRVLGKGALLVAYVLFGVAALSVGIAVYSVISSPAGSDLVAEGGL